MLLEKRRTKQGFIKSVIVSSILSLLIFGVYAFLTIQEPLFLSPLGKGISKDSELKALLEASHIPYALIVRSKDNAYEIQLESGAQIFISEKKDFNFQVSSLQRILKQLTIEGKAVRRVDFRFDKPVIVLE